jgi:hypothetical protein
MKILNKINTSWMGLWFWSYYKVLLTLWVQTTLRWGVLDTTLCDNVCQWLETGQWFSPGTSVSSTNKTKHHDITEILLKVALSTIKPINLIIGSESEAHSAYWLYRYIVVISSTTIQPQPPILQGTYTNITSYGKNISTNLRRLKLSCRWCFFTVLSVIYMMSDGTPVAWDLIRLAYRQSKDELVATIHLIVFISLSFKTER